MSYYAQKSSLEGVTINQINELRRVGAEFGQNINFIKAVNIFRSSQTEDMDDIKKLIEKNEWWDPEDYDASIERLAAAVMNGDLTISEMYRFLGTEIADSEQRRKLISQNIFGSD